MPIFSVCIILEILSWWSSAWCRMGTEVAKKIAREFLRAQYAGGRHQIRVDMLNKMA